RLAVITLEHGNPGHHKSKYDAFDHTIEHIFGELHAVLHVRPERAFVDPQPVDGNHRPTPDTNHTEDGGQQRHGNEAGPEARSNDVLERIDTNHFQAGQLLSGFHVAD